MEGIRGVGVQFALNLNPSILALRFGLGETDGTLTFFPVPTLLHEFHAFEALHH